MSIAKNALGEIVPVRERRETSGNFTANNQEIVLNLNGDQSALVYVLSDLFVGTLEFTGASDSAGASYFPIQAYTYSPGCTGGTIPLAGQPLLVDALVAANIARVYSIPVGQLKKLRIRVSAYTSGNCNVSVVSDTNTSLNLVSAEQATATLAVTVTGAAGAVAVCTLPLVAGLRHYIDSLHIVRSATVAFTPSATPTLVTTSNLPGSPVFTFGSDAGGVGIDKEQRLDCGPEGLAASVLGTNTVISCPAVTGVIWRVNCLYHLGA